MSRQPGRELLSWYKWDRTTGSMQPAPWDRFNTAEGFPDKCKTIQDHWKSAKVFNFLKNCKSGGFLRDIGDEVIDNQQAIKKGGRWGRKTGLCKKGRDETLMIPAGKLHRCSSRGAKKIEHQINQSPGIDSDGRMQGVGRT